MCWGGMFPWAKEGEYDLSRPLNPKPSRGGQGRGGGGNIVADICTCWRSELFSDWQISLIFAALYVQLGCWQNLRAKLTLSAGPGLDIANSIVVLSCVQGLGFKSARSSQQPSFQGRGGLSVWFRVAIAIALVKAQPEISGPRCRLSGGARTEASWDNPEDVAQSDHFVLHFCTSALGYDCIGEITRVGQEEARPCMRACNVNLDRRCHASEALGMTVHQHFKNASNCQAESSHVRRNLSFPWAHNMVQMCWRCIARQPPFFACQFRLARPGSR